MAIEIVDLPIKNDDFPRLCKCLPEGKTPPLSSGIFQPHLMTAEGTDGFFRGGQGGQFAQAVVFYN